jgi:hypothetical protein
VRWQGKIFTEVCTLGRLFSDDGRLDLCKEPGAEEVEGSFGVCLTRSSITTSITVSDGISCFHWLRSLGS